MVRGTSLRYNLYTYYAGSADFRTIINVVGNSGFTYGRTAARGARSPHFEEGGTGHASLS